MIYELGQIKLLKMKWVNILRTSFNMGNVTQCTMMAKRKFNSDILKDHGAIIKVKLKSTHKNALIDYYNNIKEKSTIVNALIDTGATHSVIDMTVLSENIEIEKTKFTDTHLFIHGSGATLPVYKVGLDLLNNGKSEDIYVAAMDLSIFKIPEISLKMIVGRDILSKYIFTYNGIDNTFSLDQRL